MMSNNPALGNDRSPDEIQPDTEHTTAEAQQNLTPEAELTSTTPAPANGQANNEAPDQPALVQSSDAPDNGNGHDDPDAVAEDDRVADSVVDAQDAAEMQAAMVEEEADAEDAAPSTEPAPEASSTPEPAPEPEPRIKGGTIVEGTILETSPTEILVDLGDDVVGVVASSELERMDRMSLEALVPGETVDVYIVKPRGSGGRPVLSFSRAEEEGNWKMAQSYFEDQQVYFSKIAGYNKGGLIVRFGKVRGFVPASQVSRDRQHNATGESPEARWGEMVGDDIAVKVVEIDRKRNRLILSERAATREWREKQKERLLEELAVGEIRQGRVISVADFGAFVDLGGADGLVHLTEMSWQHITHPREVMEVGQEVEVQVISIDRDRKRIGLSMKRRERDPWLDVVQEYNIGQLVQATITKLTKFGAFARLVDSPEIEGLIHISELADYRVSHPREVVLVGDVVTLRIVKIDPDQRRLGLSLRQVDSARFMEDDWDAIVGDFSDDDEADEPTIGDMVGELDAPDANDAADYDDADSDVVSDDDDNELA